MFSFPVRSAERPAPDLFRLIFLLGHSLGHAHFCSTVQRERDVRKSEECISLDCDGGDEEEIVDSSRRSPLATVLSTCLRNFPGQWHQKGDNEPRSEISLLHSDGENETERQEAKPPSPPVSLPLHAAAVDPNGATVSPTIPRGTEVISTDSDGEEEEDDDEEPQVVHCTLPPKGTAPSNYGERRPCQSSDSHPHRSTPNLHPSAFSLGNPQLVTQISEQRVISVSSNVFGCPVTSAKTELCVPTSGP